MNQSKVGQLWKHRLRIVLAGLLLATVGATVGATQLVRTRASAAAASQTSAASDSAASQTSAASDSAAVAYRRVPQIVRQRMDAASSSPTDAALVNTTLANITSSDIAFSDIAANDGAGIAYRRTPSTTKAQFDAVKVRSLNVETPHRPMEELAGLPELPYGSPGVALLDFDRDGDLDIYVSNGPDTHNSLYANQLIETGEVAFVDVGEPAGVGAFEQDSTGVCFGDIDNDGDDDLYVLGRMEPNRLFQNEGAGSFRDISDGSGAGAGRWGHSSCSLGDVNGDGLLDIFIANTFDWASLVPIVAESFAVNHHNQLLLNLGDNRFEDVSSTSGIQELAGLPLDATGSATISWSGALVDYDLDGDSDLFIADDQAAMPAERAGGVDRGYVHLLENDGSGHFTDITLEVGTDRAGQWMGLAFGDFNCDGHLDFFGTNMGDYAFPMTGMMLPYEAGDSSARWQLGSADGSFSDPGLGELIANPFGWGVSAADYDNDGDSDVIYYGSLDSSISVPTANPGAVLQNQDCDATFARDAAALVNSTDHNRRGVQGVATGDLNNDGFIDIVTAASARYPEADAPLVPFEAGYDSAFDDEAFMLHMFEPAASGVPGELRWNGYEPSRGTLAVEISSASNGNGWAQIEPLGTAGLTTNGRVNRSGIGAVIAFTPQDGETAFNTSMLPVVGGSGFASQHSLVANFGLGDAESGTVEVAWPGGTRNRLDDVRSGERLRFPEIPCGYNAAWTDAQTYENCVRTSLGELVASETLTQNEANRFLSSAQRAFRQQTSASRDETEPIQAATPTTQEQTMTTFNGSELTSTSRRK